MKNLFDAFISYGRADSKAFATKLYSRLAEVSLKVWFDQNDIPLGVDYQNQIDDGIEKAHNFLFIIAPHSVNSPYCLKEIELAIKRGKRIIPLLHVMQICEETWQQRNPNGKPEDWETYKAKGLHESYQNMHPTIRKLNWVYFQEGVNDFEESLAGLLEIFERQKTYVYQHTYFLAKALEWQRNQKQSRYLLTGEEWQQAEAWLKVQFKDEQPPCFPTQEHCELITESIKNANNLMTQVFLSHAELDTVVTEKIRRTLMREGFTLWINHTDIKTGTEFQETINRGIEEADNIVYLISPNSLRSQYCQQEIAYATRLNKHIIPLLIAPTDLGDIPTEQRSLQFIDFTEHDEENKYRTAADKLLNVLKEDTHYYEWHKLLLVKALKWDRLDQPKTLLLSGSELTNAQNWLKQSEQHQKQPPATSLHKAYITASGEMNQFDDVFISYGRADSLAFAIKLHAHLVEQGFKVWFDKEDIPLGVDYQKQIDDGIEKAHNFLYIIAPHSINSPYCGKEIELALKRNKRIIPLLHVEQINQETWKQRNPFGKPEDWEAYQAKGLHSSFQNMHPEISKINWVYFREGIDDFEVSLAGLLKLCKQQQEYVKQHTYFLAKALEWEQHQKQSHYLLIGDERKQAEAWLNIRFKEEQPPCLPTDLHCELITESIKNSNNLMTQVFLAHAEADATVMEQIRKSLRRECFTVWTNKTDIQTGEAFEDAIKRGIEQADNLAYLLSPDSLKSEYCEQELEYALSLNKRIIPILVRETPPDQVPLGLRNLQYIDLSDNAQEADYSLDESQLLKILRQDAAYYNEHKMLLTKALKWERQHRNPSILLRGYNLHSAEAWLKVAKSRQQHLPTGLQEEFIAESLRQPAAVSLDVFVSYSRTDSDFARQLNDQLQIQGKTTWFDQESIASGADFQQEIYRGIESSNNFLFILSPRSVNSPYCAGEVEYAAKLNKRFVTVLYRQVNPADLHPELAKVQWIDFNQNQRDFNANFSRLLRTLDTDREYVNSHTKWSQRALEWQEKGKSKDLLLRGNELAIAQNWLQEAEQNHKKPAITDLQKDYIRHSQQARNAGVKQEKRRVVILRSLLGLMSVAFVAAVGVSVFAWNEQKRANNERSRAEKSLGEQVDALSRYSKTLSDSNQEFDALIEGIRAGKPLLQQGNAAPKSKKSVEDVLRRAIYGVKERDRIEGKTTVSVSVSPDNKTIATINNGGTVTLWNFQGQNLATLRHDKEEITSIFFNDKDGKTIATLSKKTIKLWNNDGKERGTLPLQKEVSSVTVSPDGNKIAASSLDEDNWTVKLWNVETQQLTPFLPKEKFNDFSFSSDGKLIATQSGEGDKQIIQIWSSQGKLIKRLPTQQKFDYLSSFSPNNKLIVTQKSWDEGNWTFPLWKFESQQLTSILPDNNFKNVSFSSDGKWIVTQSGEGDKQVIQIWSSQGKPIKRLPTKEKVDYLFFSPDNKLIVTQSWDNNKQTVKFWKFETQQPTSLLPDDKFKDFSLSADGKQIATLSGEGDNQIVKIWNQNGEELQTLHLGTLVDSVYFNSEGNTIATVSPDSTIKFWTIENSDRQILAGYDASVYNVTFSPKDGSLISTWSWDGSTRIVKLWRREGDKIKPFNFSPTNEKFNYINFSPDSQLIATYSGEGDNQTVKLWSHAGDKIKSFNPFPANEKFNDVSFSEDDKLIATYSTEKDNRIVKLWSRAGDKIQLFNPFPTNEKFNNVSFSEDGKLIATYSGKQDNPTVKLWSIEGKQVQPFPTNEKFNDVSFSEDGKLIATYSGKQDNQTVKLWSIEGKQVQPLLSHEKFNNVSFSKDGKLIATFPKVSDTKGSDSKKVNSGSSDDQPVKLWSREGKELASFPSKEPVNGLEFSPDGKLIATNNQTNNKSKLWKFADQKLQPFQDGEFNRYEFSPDSKLIATANNNNNTVQIWNQEGKELAHLNFNNSINYLSFSPDGKILAIASDDKQVIMWYMKRTEWESLAQKELKELVQKACGVVGNYLKHKQKDDSDRILCDESGEN